MKDEDETSGTRSLEHTTFVFQPVGLTKDEVYALLTDNANGVLDLEDDAPTVAEFLEKHVPEHRLTDAYRALKEQGSGT